MIILKMNITFQRNHSCGRIVDACLIVKKTRLNSDLDSGSNHTFFHLFDKGIYSTGTSEALIKIFLFFLSLNQHHVI